MTLKREAGGGISLKDQWDQRTFAGGQCSCIGPCCFGVPPIDHRIKACEFGQILGGELAVDPFGAQTCRDGQSGAARGPRYTRLGKGILGIGAKAEYAAARIGGEAV